MGKAGSATAEVVAGMIAEAKSRIEAQEKTYKADAKRYGKKEVHALTQAQVRQIVSEVWNGTDTGRLIQAAIEDVEAGVGL